MIKQSHDKNIRQKVIKQSDDTTWWQKWLHEVIAHVNDTKWLQKWWQFWHRVMTKNDDQNWWHLEMTLNDVTKTMTKSDDTKWRIVVCKDAN